MNKIKYLIMFILLLVLALISSGCKTESSQQQLENMSNKVVQEYTLPFANDGGINLGLFDMRGKLEDAKSFNINKGDKFQKIISLGNMVDQERHYKVILFVDFKQQEFVANSNKVSEYDFKAKDHENILIPVEINDLQEGFHDIFFVIVKHPDIKSLDEDFRMATDMNNLLFIRFNVLVGDTIPPNINLNTFENETPTIFDGIFLSKEKDKLLVWTKEDVEDLKNVDFNIHVGNESYDEQQDFAVITLLNWKQVDFHNNQNVVFFSLKKGAKLFIPASFNVPNEQGIYDLVSILIHNPYEALNLYNKNIETGIRVGINVK